jgi:hypothetical protein
MQAHVVVIKELSRYPVVVLTEACLLGYAYLLEGVWKKAIEWVTRH